MIRETQMKTLLDEGNSIRVVAEMMGVPAGTVSSFVRRSGYEPKSRAHDRRMLKACALIDEGLPDKEVAQLAQVKETTVANLRAELEALDGLQ